MKSLQTLWNVYTQGDPVIQDSINKFVADINMLARGQQPVGPLSNMATGQQPNSQANQDPVVAQMRQELATLRQELGRFRQMTEQERNESIAKQQENNRAEAEKTVDSWISTKEKSGIKLSQDELVIMSDLMSVMDEKGQPKLSLDEAHNMALAKLGKLQSSVAKQVINDANKARKRSPRGSAGEEPESNTIKGILSQGFKHMTGE
jgi:Fic family protein